MKTCYEGMCKKKTIKKATPLQKVLQQTSGRIAVLANTEVVILDTTSIHVQ